MKKNDIYTQALDLHQHLRGKFELKPKVQVKTIHDLSLIYTPGVAAVSEAIAKDYNKAFSLTIKNNTVAVISDGSAVLGLGNIGPYAAIPVMEGKAMLFKEFANIDAFPICLQTQDPSEIINIVKNIAPVFAGINLEDISAPRCFEIENALGGIGIPVFHDDQHGSSVVVLAALINASKLADKDLKDLVVVISGAGAAGTAIANLLRCIGHDSRVCEPVKDVIVCDSQGIISLDRVDIANNPVKAKLASVTNKHNKNGTLCDAMQDADVFVGVSRGNLVSPSMIKSMNDKPIIIAMANPTPEIMPHEALDAGAYIVGTGRSDYPNQINNLLVFPGIFRGALDVRAKSISSSMQIAAAYALAQSIVNPTRENILPSPLDREVPFKIAAKVSKAYLEEV